MCLPHTLDIKYIWTGKYLGNNIKKYKTVSLLYNLLLVYSSVITNIIDLVLARVVLFNFAQMLYKIDYRAERMIKKQQVRKDSARG